MVRFNHSVQVANCIISCRVKWDAAEERWVKTLQCPFHNHKWNALFYDFSGFWGFLMWCFSRVLLHEERFPHCVVQSSSFPGSLKTKCSIDFKNWNLRDTKTGKTAFCDLNWNPRYSSTLEDVVFSDPEGGLASFPLKHFRKAEWIFKVSFFLFLSILCF